METGFWGNFIRLFNKLSGVFLAIAILWLCWGLARLLWLFLAVPQAPKLPTVAKQAPVQTNTNLTDFNVFSRPKPIQPAQSEPMAPSNIKVKGVFVASPAENSAAVLDVNGKVKNYKINDNLENTAYKLAEVDWNEIIIMDNNNVATTIVFKQSMNLNQKDKLAGNNQPHNTHQNTPSSQDNPLRNHLAQSLASGIPQTPTPEYLDNANTAQTNPATEKQGVEAAIDNAITQLQQDPAGYLSQMGVMSTGEGYLITNEMPQNFRKRLGLKTGDKVITVNGQSIGSNPGADASLLQSIRQSGQAQIQLQRGEQIITVRQKF